MKISDLFENAAMDVQESMWAETARKALIARIETDPRFQTQIVGLKTGNAVVDHMLRFAAFKFIVGKGGGLFIQDTRFRDSAGGTIELEVPGEITPASVVAHLRSREGASTFRHEFQHFLDFNSTEGAPQSGEFDMKKMKAGDKDHRSRYLNSDAEFSAYLKEIAEPLLKVLRAAREGDEEVLRAAKIEPDFRKYIRGQHSFQTLDHMGVLNLWNTGYRVRMLKRLAALHKAATAISGVAQPWSPTRAQAVISWLARTLKSLGVGQDKAWGKGA